MVQQKLMALLQKRVESSLGYELPNLWDGTNGAGRIIPGETGWVLLLNTASPLHSDVLTALDEVCESMGIELA